MRSRVRVYELSVTAQKWHVVVQDVLAYVIVPNCVRDIVPHWQAHLSVTKPDELRAIALQLSDQVLLGRFGDCHAYVVIAGPRVLGQEVVVEGRLVREVE